MDLILCHTTADFDTLGAAVGLARLHPGARIVLTGGGHPAVRQFLAFHRDEYPLIERRSVNPEKVRSLIIVDTQLRSRLGKGAEWLDLPQVEVEIYDHHADVDSDIAAKVRHVEPVGAVTTMVVERLQEQGIIPTPIEATVMALGIHVDTGSLTFGHSTARDARALAWLMEQGASLRVIGEYTDPGLSTALQQLLSVALDRLQTETVQGHTIAWVLLDLDGFTPGLSGLTSRLMEVTDVDALLLAAQYTRKPTEEEEDGSVSLIGRSRIEGTDLNELFKPIGGGGHPRAAAANLHHVDAAEVLEELVSQFKAQIPHPPTARELMSSPVRTIRPETTIDEAQRILLRYGHSGLSVVDEAGTLVGVISRRDLDIALHHGFSHAPVKGYMTTNLKTIAPETPLPDIEAIMVTYDVGRLPVLDRGQLVGIVTRTDVLRQLHKNGVGNGDRGLGIGDWGLGKTAASRLPTPYSLLPLLQQALVPDQWTLLTRAAQAAEARGWQLFLVGGAVRDLLMTTLKNGGAKAGQLLIEDIDLVVDGFHRAADVGAGVELARSLQALYPEARLEVHGKFQTAALLWHHDPVFKSLWIDIATARTEFYPYPAANPEVEASSIQQDLYRRDFTINALAIRLTPPRNGELLDFFGGVLDLQSKQIRVLHANSFIEDPTRIFRAVRFAVRLHFQIDEQTEGYIRHAIASGIYRQIHDQTDPKFRAPALQTRLKAELKSILQAPYWKAALHYLADLGALQCIHPTFEPNPELWRQLRLIERWLKWQNQQQHFEFKIQNSKFKIQDPDWLLLLETLLAHVDPQYRGAIAENMQLPADSIERLSQLATVQEKLSQALPTCTRPSQVVQLLQPYDLPMLVLLAIRSDRATRRQIWRYLMDWSLVKAPLNGRDLKALGYRPGPQFKEILEALTAATVDGQIRDRAEAETFLQQKYPL
ncbi:CBS domain-containing protein [Leptodesmis sichuanensis]|uniref:CBS domain-containing protein n=1 Tax=Leptodesmis sichuanensis TaxID=2906798 RepID=UPI001F1C3C3F|nr:CBS domain-containing protein [Leptodesmis sichuanensis]UIE37269.1 CBS domain-containing protein [Leptodesmis sichuanensis A121]